ncbi:NF041680 family putative transposase [Dactylosporangium sp. AC04546]|uniref:NF041680 family putative transposase n=1 Tax=Dactylosporangium sp. AC04546 TaxID=2862460 RepID=UPI002E7BFB1F|nr:NF041680 family putative transposase [Dactylosporangium sp. AC04546]WVK89640.1 NF041680 family putative transposase [Dactylosporangium sp. AC04546]
MSVHDGGRGGAVGDLGTFRGELHGCLTARGDALFELVDAVLCADGPVRSLPALSLVAEHRRGHGALYDALAAGRVDVGRLRSALVSAPMPRAADGRIVLAVDVTCWLRPEAHTSPERILCHTAGRSKGEHVGVPGWPYSFVVALETGRSSWTAPLDAVRLVPGADLSAVTARQVRDVVAGLVAAGHRQSGDPDIWIVMDAGYDAARLAWLLRDLPVRVLARLRSDRVLRRAAPARLPGELGRPRRHGGEFIFGDPASWDTPDVTTTTETRLYGTATARAWHRLHPRLTRRAAWADCPDLPILPGTLIRLDVARLPSGATAKPVWLWYSASIGDDSGDSGHDPDAALVDLLWQAFLRRFDIEHTFRLLKQTLGWTVPKLRDPHAADRWTWLIIAAYTQLRLARPLAADLRRPWEKPAAPQRLTPARVRRGFRHLRTTTVCPASAPKSSRPGPGRPRGRPNRHPTRRHDVHTVTSNDTAKTNPKKKKPTDPRPRRTG